MGILKNLGKKLETKLDQLATCPACRHNTPHGIKGCTCKRNDCTCTHRNR